MTFKKTINLTAYEVEYIDQRQEKPRTVQQETVVLDGGRISALNRLDMRPSGYIIKQFERSGYAVTNIRKGETIAAPVDLAELWSRTMTKIRLDKVRAIMKPEESEARK